MKAKRLLSMGLAAAVCVGTLGLAGCGSKGSDSAENTFSWWLYTDDGAGTYYNSFEDNPSVQWLNQQYWDTENHTLGTADNGSELHFTFQTPIEGSEQDNFNTMIGTGEYTDLLDMSLIADPMGFYDDGVIMEITDYVEKYMPDYVAYLDDVLAQLEELVSSLSEEEKPTVLHGNSVYDLNIDGSNTIIDAWITAAGGTNAAAEVEGNMQTVTMEQILVWDPDVIITGTKSEVEEIMNDPEWAGLTAVQNGQVYTNPKGVFSWDRYGVEEALQLQWVANLLHPELFNIDIRTQVKDFYETFLHYTLTDEQVELILNAEAPQ